MSKRIKCPHCGRMVNVRTSPFHDPSEYLEPHRTVPRGPNQCKGTVMPKIEAERLNKSKDEGEKA